jgi:DNA-directed RNA polymerase specialized sigma24 family protein
VAAGRFPQLADRHDLWSLLLVITARKAGAQLRQERRHKRGGGAVRGESALVAPAGTSNGRGLEQLAAPQPTPDLAAQLAEEYARHLQALGDDTLRAIALLKLEGYTNDEIAARLDCVPRTIERKLHVIRLVWEKEARP